MDLSCSFYAELIKKNLLIHWQNVFFPHFSKSFGSEISLPCTWTLTPKETRKESKLEQEINFQFTGILTDEVWL